jgi:isopentenyl diphosphate isomerase/L-lactate dehydrogenase-like FMN-dependent dehydrogenase
LIQPKTGQTVSRNRLFSSDDARHMAHRRLPRIVFDYIDGAVGNESAAANNLSALENLRLMPRVLAPTQQNLLTTTFMGQNLSLPFGIAPMGMCNLAWPGADRMLAAEAVRRGMPHGVSTAASSTLEGIAEQAGALAWFQLYVTGSLETAWALVDRAEASGYQVLILTVDVPRFAPRPRDQRNGFNMPFRIGIQQFMDFARHPHWSLASLIAGVPAAANFDATQGGKSFDRYASRAGANWAFLDQLRRRWKGKLIVKGVLNPDDAKRIRAAGADAVYVSNHGGRQLDSAPPAITALAQVRAALGPEFPLIFDSGVRSGEDILKALACGADLVMLGRPLLYALGADGARGLSSLLDAIAESLLVAMAQIGLSDINDINTTHLAAPLR